MIQVSFAPKTSSSKSPVIVHVNHSQNLINSESFLKHFTNELIQGRGFLGFSAINNLSLVNHEMQEACKKIHLFLINSNVSSESLIKLFPNNADRREMIRYAANTGFVSLMQALAMSDPLNNKFRRFKTERFGVMTGLFFRFSLDNMIRNVFSHQKNIPLIRELIRMLGGSLQEETYSQSQTYIMRAVLRKEYEMMREIIQVLLEAGDNIHATVKDLESKYYGYTALMIAADVKNFKAVKLLASFGADINASYDGKTSLMLAAEKNDFQAVEKLKELESVVPASTTRKRHFIEY